MDVTGTSDEQPEVAGRRQMVIHASADRLTVEVTDPVIVAAGQAALRALGEDAIASGDIRGDQAGCASLSSVWQALRDSLAAIQQDDGHPRPRSGRSRLAGRRSVPGRRTSRSRAGTPPPNRYWPSPQRVASRTATGAPPSGANRICPAARHPRIQGSRPRVASSRLARWPHTSAQRLARSSGSPREASWYSGGDQKSTWRYQPGAGSPGEPESSPRRPKARGSRT